MKTKCKELVTEFLGYTPENESEHLTRINITYHEIVEEMRTFLEENLRIRLFCTLAVFQIRGVGQHEGLHTHRTYKSDYNSLLYLNDDFTGGEFYTDNGFTHAPKAGDILFFNGKKIRHGVRKIIGNRRMAINFWWDIVPDYPSVFRILEF
jgi:hypothetical protein